jgi:hypothetical protein
LVDRETFEAALEAFVHRFAIAPTPAAARLVRDLLDPVAGSAGKPAWVEMTPANVLRGRELLSMFPTTRIIHSVRDGRDTACSLVARKWKPSIAEAMEWWASRMERALRAAKSLPASHLLVVELEDLVERDRDDTYQRLLGFLGLREEPDMRAFFDRSVTAEQAHIGRWRDELSRNDQAWISKRYEEALADFQAKQLTL